MMEVKTKHGCSMLHSNLRTIPDKLYQEHFVMKALLLGIGQWVLYRLNIRQDRYGKFDLASSRLPFT